MFYIIQENMNKKVVAIILGNRLNDDGTITLIQEQRLLMALDIEKTFNPDYFILTGGLANEKAQKTEAQAMYEYLVNKGLNKDKLILEENSYTTVDNAKYSIPIAKKLKAEIIIVCSSPYHFVNPIHKCMESFTKELEDSNIVLMTYCQSF